MLNYQLIKPQPKKGAVITIAINLTNEKKVVKKVVAGDCEVTTIEENKKYSFVMKDSNVLVTVELEDAPKKLHDIQVLHDEGISNCKIIILLLKELILEKLNFL